MTALTTACRNMLVQTPEVVQLVAEGKIGKGTTWTDGWIFADFPYANIEKRSHKSLIVITQNGSWAEANEHNTARFPRMFVDIWASPTRDPGDEKSVQVKDADNLIEEVFNAISPYLHTVNPSVPGNPTIDPALPYMGKPGFPRRWGTAAELSTGGGVIIMRSIAKSLDADFRDVEDGNGARMGRYIFNIETV